MTISLGDLIRSLSTLLEDGEDNWEAIAERRLIAEDAMLSQATAQYAFS